MVSREGVGFVRRLLEEAEAYLAKGDAVQSSEKLYKAAEESVKALAERFDLEEVKAAGEKGRWTVALLEKAIRKIADRLGIGVRLAWAEANYLHVWGFHERRLDADDVASRVPTIRGLVELVEKS